MHPRRSSATARLIARCVLLAGHNPRQRQLVPAGTTAPLVAILAADDGHAWFRFAVRHVWTRALLRAAERAVLPGIITHYLARKQWLERSVIAALKAGCPQVVVLGAGFDPLAWRLHRHWPRVQFLELDHPATQAPKQRGLGSAPNVSFIGLDLAKDSPAAALQACPAFRPDQPATFVAEGLLMYFPEARVTALLSELAAFALPQSEVLFSFMEPARDGSISFRDGPAVIGWWLRWRREPFQWGIARAALTGFMGRTGWRLVAAAGHEELSAQVLAPHGLADLPLARGEGLGRCVASPA